jgi:hypothetical protein
MRISLPTTFSLDATPIRLHGQNRRDSKTMMRGVGGMVLLMAVAMVAARRVPDGGEVLG